MIAAAWILRSIVISREWWIILSTLGERGEGSSEGAGGGSYQCPDFFHSVLISNPVSVAVSSPLFFFFFVLKVASCQRALGYSISGEKHWSQEFCYMGCGCLSLLPEDPSRTSSTRKWRHCCHFFPPQQMISHRMKPGRQWLCEHCCKARRWSWFIKKSHHDLVGQGGVRGEADGCFEEGRVWVKAPRFKENEFQCQKAQLTFKFFLLFLKSWAWHFLECNILLTVWLCWVFVVEVGSFVAECGLSCPMTCGICYPTRDWSCIPCVGRRILNHWTTREFLFKFFLVIRDSLTHCSVALGGILCSCERYCQASN